MPLLLVQLKIPDWAVRWNYFNQSQLENLINERYVHEDGFQENIFCI